MKITTSQVQKMAITDIDNLDPVNVIAEDLGPGRGKITIESYGDCWSYYWGAMGTSTIKQFFIGCEDDYVARKLSPDTHRTVNDESHEALTSAAKKHILEGRKDGNLTKKNARELWDKIDLIDDTGLDANHRVLSDIFGYEWYECIPQVINHKYEYLIKIIRTVRDAFRLSGETK